MTTACALGAPEDAVTVADLVDQLDSSSLTEREDAALSLRNRADELNDAIGDAVLPDELTPEQRARVLYALHQRFVLTPRAGLGVSFNEDPVEEFKTVGVRIMATVEGFPAHLLLQPGDLLLEANGASLVGLPRSYAVLTLRHAILSLDPGEVIGLVIERGGERLELDVATRSYTDLNQPLPSSRYLEGAWNMRVERLGFGHGDIDRLEQDELEDWTASFKRRGDLPGLLPAGRPRAEGDADRSVAALARLDADHGAMTRMRLDEEERARQLLAFIEDTRRRLSQRQGDLQQELPGSKQAQRIVEDIREMERQLAQAQRQYKETRARLGNL